MIECLAINSERNNLTNFPSFSFLLTRLESLKMSSIRCRGSYEIPSIWIHQQSEKTAREREETKKQQKEEGEGGVGAPVPLSACFDEVSERSAGASFS